jgi:hypothetical protein
VVAARALDLFWGKWLVLQSGIAENPGLGERGGRTYPRFVSPFDRFDQVGVVLGAVLAFAVLLGVVLVVFGSIWKFALILAGLVAITLIAKNAVR